MAVIWHNKAMSKKLKIGLHIHSWLSDDASWIKEEFIDLYESAGFNALAICDHDEIAAARELQKSADFKIIIGEEINTQDGEIIGLFLKDKIAAGLSLEETIAQIHQQKALVYLPHPFDRLRRQIIDPVKLKKSARHIDFVEVMNARNLFKGDDKKALEFARKYQITPIIGADAHTRFEVNSAYMEIDDFNSPSEFLTAVKNGRMVKKYSPIWVHLLTKFQKTKQR